MNVIVMALQEESQGLFEKKNINPLYTGVGKVNASISLTKFLIENPAVDFVINFGTVGSFTLPKGSIVECIKFIQRDVDLSIVGLKKGQFPFEKNFEIVCKKTKLDILKVTCGTGDSITTLPDKDLKYDVMDMEAYALAKVCSTFDKKFICIKYVTDNSKDNIFDSWKSELKFAAESFLNVYEKLVQEV